MSEQPRRRRIAQRYKDLAAEALRHHADRGTIDRDHTGRYLYGIADLMRDMDKRDRIKTVRVVDLTIWHEEYSDGSTATVLSPGDCTHHGQPAMPSLTLVLALLEWGMMAAPDGFAD